MNRKRTNNKNSRSVRAGRSGRISPPQFVPTIGVTHRFRFNSGSNSGTYSITAQRLLNFMQIATSAVTAVDIIQAIKLSSVELWTNPQALGADPTSVSLEWNSSSNSPSILISDTSMGVRPAHIRCTPPINSSASWWWVQGGAGAELFKLVVPANTIIDVVMELRVVDTDTPSAGDTPAGATIGQMYGGYLDGLTSGMLAPIGLTPIP
jgi:hypothetical protein